MGNRIAVIKGPGLATPGFVQLCRPKLRQGEDAESEHWHTYRQFFYPMVLFQDQVKSLN